MAHRNLYAEFENDAIPERLQLGLMDEAQKFLLMLCQTTETFPAVEM